MLAKPLKPLHSVAFSTFVGLLFFLGGYWLIVDTEHDAYGVAMFVVMPVVSGFAVGATARRGTHAVACLALTLSLLLILGLGSLMAGGFEGWICCLMALPLLMGALVIGALIGYGVRGQYINRPDHDARNTLLLLLVCPFLMAAANEVERPWRHEQRRETFTTEVRVPALPPATWEKLVRMTSMDGDKPFLLQIGLPVPYRCTLSHDGVGGRRTCYFDQGIIEMDVTDWQPPTAVGMRVTGSTLPGRRWLTFADASYELIPEGTGTRVIRHSTIASRLYPRWYWRPFEAWGVQSEHQFVLSSLAKSAP